MKEVILVNYTGRKGGGPINALEMAKGFFASGHLVIAILSKDVSNKKEWESVGFEKLIYVDSFSSIFDLLKQVLFFRTWIGKKVVQSLQGYKIKFIYCPMVSLFTYRINRLFRKEKVCVVNHDPIPHSGDKGTLLLNLFGMQSLYRSADCIVLHSEKFLDFVKMQYGKEKQVQYVPLGPQNVKGRGVPKLNYNPDDINFLFFGRIEKYKGIEVLLKAYQKTKEQYSNTSLSIVGNGDFSSYSSLAAKLKDCTVVNQWIADEEVGDYFLGNNLVLVLPYLDATQSGPVLIAYQYGIPAIVSDTGGLKAQVNEKTGLLVEAGNVDSLAEAMLKVCHNPDWIPSTKEGIQEYLEQISWKHSAKRIVDFMDDLNESGDGNGG